MNRLMRSLVCGASRVLALVRIESTLNCYYRDAGRDGNSIGRSGVI